MRSSCRGDSVLHGGDVSVMFPTLRVGTPQTLACGEPGPRGRVFGWGGENQNPCRIWVVVISCRLRPEGAFFPLHQGLQSLLLRKWDRCSHAYKDFFLRRAFCSYGQGPPSFLSVFAHAVHETSARVAAVAYEARMETRQLLVPDVGVEGEHVLCTFRRGKGASVVRATHGARQSR